MPAPIAHTSGTVSYRYWVDGPVYTRRYRYFWNTPLADGSPRVQIWSRSQNRWISLGAFLRLPRTIDAFDPPIPPAAEKTEN